LGEGVERNSGATELQFEATSRFTEVNLVLGFLNAEENEGLGLVDFGGTDEKVLVPLESGFLCLSFRFRSNSIVRVWYILGFV